ncbi:FecR family protein [Chitinophaga vietnamensis]|uniref:FecR family protein n=1 Tax=Chitinophaga vietnamensis TaxID=2593957 RepID=UPI0011786BF5|nr:FecR domain-containing protein [Chitinophaga vietnamensis]
MTQRFWELLSRYWSGDISTEELSELESMMVEHPDAWLKSGLVNQVSFRKEPLHSAGLTDRLMERIGEKVTAPPPRKRLQAVAAPLCILLACAGLFLLYHFYYKANKNYKQVATEMGMKTKLRLPDGSTIWLNAGSRLRYPDKFSKSSREVYLSGEGYFDIAQMADKPFIIHTDKMDIKVLGTAFNVRSYDDEDYAETAVVKGAVEVTMKDEAHPGNILLKPNQKVVWRKQEATPAATARQQKTIVVERQPLSMIGGDSTLTEEVAWMSNRLVFHNETMAALAHRLERWYGMKVLIQDNELAQRRVSGRADNLPIEKLLDILQKIAPFEYRIEDNTVIIQ